MAAKKSPEFHPSQITDVQMQYDTACKAIDASVEKRLDYVEAMALGDPEAKEKLDQLSIEHRDLEQHRKDLQNALNILEGKAEKFNHAKAIEKAENNLDALRAGAPVPSDVQKAATTITDAINLIGGALNKLPQELRLPAALSIHSTLSPPDAAQSVTALPIITNIGKAITERVEAKHKRRVEFAEHYLEGLKAGHDDPEKYAAETIAAKTMVERHDQSTLNQKETVKRLERIQEDTEQHLQQTALASVRAPHQEEPAKGRLSIRMAAQG